jgi:pimeloyl-ACP methyl ester carboxylesterase
MPASTQAHIAMDIRSTSRIPLASWETAGRYFDYRGQRVFFVRAGESAAETLLLIHGFPTSSWDWEAVWGQLSARFHLCAPDLLGFGFSAKPKRYAYSVIDQADLIETLLTDQGVRAYHVLAHDYGDSVAQELLARCAESTVRPRLRSVAFLNGGLFPETHRALFMQKVLASPFGRIVARLSRRSDLARSLRRIFGPATQPDTALIDAFWDLISRDDGALVMPKLLGYLRERRMQRPRWVGALQGARVPLKLICGAVDPISGAHMAARYRELVPHTDMTLLPNIGHYPQIEDPAAVLTAFLDFQARCVSRPL